MNENFDDLMDEWIEIDADLEAEEETDSSSLTWDDEVVFETHRTVANRALWASLRRSSFRWSDGMAA